MTLEEVIVTETAGIAPAYPLERPSDAGDECIVYQFIDIPELQVAKYVVPRVQLTCWAPTYGAAVALGDDVRDLFYDRHVTVGGVHYCSKIVNSYDIKDSDAGLYGRIVDVHFTYRKS